MNENIEQKLGFDRVRHMVREHTSNTLAERMAEEMSFQTDFAHLEHELHAVDEMRRILLLEPEFPHQDFIDLSPMLSRLHVGNTFLPQEALFDLKLSLRTIRDCYHFLTAEEHQEYTELRNAAIEVELGYGGKASQLNVINSRLGQLIDDHGEIFDNASPTLAEIRRTKERKQAEVEAGMNHALARAKREGWASEGAEITMRDGHPVIPLLTTHRRKMKGLIQDESATRQTAFVEPSEVVELSNDLRELDFDERHEIQRILLLFSDRLRPLLPQLEEAYRFLARVDFLRAKARVALEMNASIPVLHEKPTIGWIEARHPLLYMQKREAVVPFELSLSAQEESSAEEEKGKRILVISGPNAGGKSVLLKAVGLIQYMLQCGMAVPIRDTSECGLFNDVFIDIGDQQSIDNDLSTYTSHLQNMKRLLADASDGTLFLLDELGGGTEPRSGCAIAEAVLEELYEKGSFGVVTTHFADLKLLAEKMPAIENGAMLFDTERMRPLYRLAVGHPGSSFAFEIAESIGFPKEVLERAGSKVGREQLNFEHQLQQLELDKREVQRQKEQLQAADDFLNEVTQKYQRLSDSLQERRHEIISSARREAGQILTEANRTVERTISDIKSAHAEREATRKAREKLAEATLQNEQQTLRAEEKAAERKKKASAKTQTTKAEEEIPIREGCIVRIDGQDTFGEVVEIKGRKAVVESNSLRMTIALDRLHATRKQHIPSARGEVRVSRGIYDEMNEKRSHFNPTLDLRGHRAEEALDMLHRFIDDALLLSEKEVRILHGKGYGILMQAVQQELRTMREVRAFRAEKVEFGGAGVTIVELR